MLGSATSNRYTRCGMAGRATASVFQILRNCLINELLETAVPVADQRVGKVPFASAISTWLFFELMNSMNLNASAGYAVLEEITYDCPPSGEPTCPAGPLGIPTIPRLLWSRLK